MKHINAFRWWLFKKLNFVVWAICPEPHKSNLGKIWERAKIAAAAVEEEEIGRRVVESHRAAELRERAMRQRNAHH